MGWQNLIATVFQAGNTIINPDGMFTYFPVPGSGNLVASTGVAVAGTDQYGNVYMQGDTVYGTSKTAIQLFTGAGSAPSIDVYTGDAIEAFPGEVLSQVSGSGVSKRLAMTLRAPRVTGEAAGAAANISLISPTADLTGDAQVTAVLNDGAGNQTVLTVDPVLWLVQNNAHILEMLVAGVITDGISASQGRSNGSPGIAAPWDNVTTFLNGWTATAATDNRVRFMAELDMIWLELTLTPGTLTDSTHIATLPAATGGGSYLPARTKNLWAGTRGGTAMTNAPIVQVLASGDLQVLSMPTGTSSVRVNGGYFIS